MADFDLHGTISRLFVYPIKSCAGVELQESLLVETGLEFDRAWMVVDERGEFISQREFPRMALVRPQLKAYEMIVKAPGMLALHIALDSVQEACRATVWDDTCRAFDMGDIAAQWFTDFLMQDRPPGVPAMKLRLVRFDPDYKRHSSMKWTKGRSALNQFSDGYPILVLSEASMDELNQKLQARGDAPVSIERFRPNIVLTGIEAHDEDRTERLSFLGSEAFDLLMVKPCPRCPIPDIDPATAEKSSYVGAMLQTYRQDSRVDGALTFGMNAIVANDAERFDLPIAVGQRFQGNLGL